MEENKDLDTFIRKTIQEVGVEKPSLDFTKAVLSKIGKDEVESPVFKHEPIFSKTTWTLVFAVIAFIFTYVIFRNSSQESTWLAAFNLKKMESFSVFNEISESPISVAVVYGVLAVTICTWVQIAVLKKQMRKEFNFN